MWGYVRRAYLHLCDFEYVTIDVYLKQSTYILLNTLLRFGSIACVRVCVCAGTGLHAKNVSGFRFACSVNTDQINIPKSNANYSFAS